MTRLSADDVEVPRFLLSTIDARRRPLRSSRRHRDLPLTTWSKPVDVLPPVRSRRHRRRLETVLCPRYRQSCSPASAPCAPAHPPSTSCRRSTRRGSCTGCRHVPTGTSTCSTQTARIHHQHHLCDPVHPYTGPMLSSAGRTEPPTRTHRTPTASSCTAKLPLLCRL